MGHTDEAAAALRQAAALVPTQDVVRLTAPLEEAAALIMLASGNIFQEHMALAASITANLTDVASKCNMLFENLNHSAGMLESGNFTTGARG